MHAYGVCVRVYDSHLMISLLLCCSACLPCDAVLDPRKRREALRRQGQRGASETHETSPAIRQPRLSDFIIQSQLWVKARDEINSLITPIATNDVLQDAPLSFCMSLRHAQNLPSARAKHICYEIRDKWRDSWMLCDLVSFCFPRGPAGEVDGGR